jgi:hypothetical protein
MVEKRTKFGCERKTKRERGRGYQYDYTYTRGQEKSQYEAFNVIQPLEGIVKQNQYLSSIDGIHARQCGKV